MYQHTWLDKPVWYGNCRSSAPKDRLRQVTRWFAELGKAEQTNKLEVASTTSLHHPLHPLASSVKEEGFMSSSLPPSGDGRDN